MTDFAKSNGGNTNNNNNNNSYIVRDRNTFLKPKGGRWGGPHFYVRTPFGAVRRPTSNRHGISRIRGVGGSSTLPQIAIKRKDECGVVLLNGNWDTSNEIPNIIAEMHNVNVEELQGCLHRGVSSKHLKMESTVDALGSPMGSDSGIEGDCSEGNLSWLLNYKIQELPPVPDCAIPETQTFNLNHFQPTNCPTQTFVATEPPKQFYFHPQQQQQQIQNVSTQQRQEKSTTPSSCRLLDDGKSHHNNSYRYAGPKKPPFTYTELIEHALNEKGELTVSGIYQWISDHFPFYKQNDDRWKNSVRHNLSINPHFRKGSKAIHGAGHLWTIAQKEDKKTWNIKKQRMQQFIQTTLNDWNKEKQQEMELAAATASILPADGREDVNNHANVLKMEIGTPQIQGVNQKQNVEVEYIIDMSTGLGDFLCPPVSKEEVVEECGLGGGDFLITDLNPNALGLNLTEAEIINGSNLYDDLNFQCYELQTE
ncbi:uncharacterized protein [Onthophagus taurus]|uniref:uncharacterized protein isoform X2 n=1 Tax=Onthophagus taurus TaxID=166361 RepID=UPI000C200EDE|nr:uncharacterized protein LOC111416884 isoform X2 [Onthophagus taurus]